MARLGTLAEFDFDQLDLRIARVLRKHGSVKSAIRIAAAKVAGTNFPDQIPPVRAVVRADRALARVVRTTARTGAI